MPLKLVEPRLGKTPYFYIRGTYLGVYVEESTGTSVKAVARGFLQAKREAIERGELRSRRAVKAEPTFLSAAISYINAGGERRFIGEFDDETGKWKPGLILHFGETPLSQMTQEAIDEAAATLYPSASAATRNRQVYTPVSAILRHAGVKISLRRPKGAQGSIRVQWLRPEQVFRMLTAAEKIDPEFAIFLTFLCYTGCRLGDALNLTCDRVHITEAFVYFDVTKNDSPRGAHLPPVLVASLANHPSGLGRGKSKVFRFRKNGRLYTLLRKVKTATGPDVGFAGFHTFCHTWATWMRRYGGLDTRGLVGTTRWKDLKSAARYEHVDVTEESMKSNLLPIRGKNKRGK